MDEETEIGESSPVEGESSTCGNFNFMELILKQASKNPIAVIL